MSKDLLVSMLRKGQNGDQILQILDTITSSDAQIQEPTSEEIDFWCDTVRTGTWGLTVLRSYVS